MQLTAEQAQRFQEWALAHGIARQCPACHRDEPGWLYLVAAPSMNADGQIIKGGVPMVAYACGHCVSVRWFLAIPMGLVSPDA